MLLERFARRLGSLWRAGLDDLVEPVADEVLQGTARLNAWIATLRVLRHEPLVPARRARLEVCAARLAPSTIDERLDAYFCTSDMWALFADRDTRELALRELARDVLSDDPSAVERRIQVGVRKRDWGSALASVAVDPVALWEQVANLVRQLPPAERDVAVLAGMLDALLSRDAAAVARLLDDALRDAALLPHFVELQVRDGLTVTDAQRLIVAAHDPHVPTVSLAIIGFGRSADQLPAGAHAEVVLAVAARADGGVGVALELVAMRLLGRGAGAALEPETAAVGRQLLGVLKLGTALTHRDEALASVAKACLRQGDTGDEAVADRLLRALARAATESNAEWTGEFVDLARTLCALFPHAGLDAFLDGTDLSDDFETELAWRLKQQLRPFERVDDAEVVRWARADPTVRAPQIARALPLLSRDEGSGALRIAPLGRALLDLMGPAPEPLLRALSQQFAVDESTGSRAAAHLPYLALAAALMREPAAAVARWARGEYERLERERAFWASREARETEHGFESL